MSIKLTSAQNSMVYHAYVNMTQYVMSSINNTLTEEQHKNHVEYLHDLVKDIHGIDVSGDALHAMFMVKLVSFRTRKADGHTFVKVVGIGSFKTFVKGYKDLHVDEVLSNAGKDPAEKATKKGKTAEEKAAAEKAKFKKYLQSLSADELKGLFSELEKATAATSAA